MFDMRWIRDNLDVFDYGLIRRGLVPLAEQVLALDKARRDAQTRAQTFQHRRNRLAKEIGVARSRGEDVSALLAQGIADKDVQGKMEAQVARLTDELEGPQGLLMALPNLPADDIPDGPDESANVELRRVGTPPIFSFPPKEHDAIGTALGLMDFECAGRLSGARFVVLKGALARLERALAIFMLDLHTTEFGYIEVNPPALVRAEALFGTGQLPKFAADLFRTNSNHWLIPTAEVPLTGLVAGKILDEAVLPLRYVAMTWCFRAEAGAAGKDTRGMIRQHQFTKVELVSIVHPDQSDVEHQRMTVCAEEVLKRLELPYRVVALCTGDMGFASRRTHDIEVWLPGQRRYREVSSCSDCGDFQARRMKARFRSAGAKGARFVHTLNGSGLAVGRTLIAVLENYQEADGTVVVPPVLRPYMNGLEVIDFHA